ncbi:RNA-directed DNA polymerase, eukaryota, reverse transcriptase zinc-binding domain protein, partial [Tanacetum coccineum]
MGVGKRFWIRDLCFKHNINFLGVQESKMTRLELFCLRSMWGNYSFDYACSMARGLSGGIISMWDPAVFTKENIWCNDNYVIVQGKWLNISHSYFMVNIYGPQDPTAKATLWSSLLSFAQHHQGRPILLHTLKTDYGPIPFKFFHSWFHRKDIDVVVNQVFVDTPQAATVNRKKEAIALLQDIDHKIDSSMASDSEKETRLQLLHEIHNIDRMESMELFQKARIKWDIKGDENTKFFHTLIKQNRRIQAIQGIMVDGTWVSNPVQVKEAFLDFYKENFQSHVPQAFDSVNWKYLDYVRSQFRFREKWRSWIRECLHFARTSILVNGSPTSEFSIKRGLHQGDPLSPFLFNLIIEGLRIAIKDATRSNLIKGVTVGNPGMRLSHFFYADDVVLVTEWNQVGINNIIRLLNVFYLASGLRININKSNVYGIRVSNNDIEGMAWITGCSAGSFPLTYLGLPIGSSIKRLTHWQSLVDKFKARLSRWKAKLLSIGGRSTLVKAILGSVGIYYMSNFKVLETMFSSLERLRSKFFWGAEQHSNKLIMIKWENALASFEKGGLGFGSLKAFNLSLLQKCRWPLVSNPNLLWVRVIKAIHGEEAGLTHFDCKSKGVWANIIDTINNLHSKNIIPFVGLTHDGSFTVGATRKHIDDVILPTLSVETSWCNILPRKVDLDMPSLYSHSDWESWFDNIRVSNEVKKRIQGKIVLLMEVTEVRGGGGGGYSMVVVIQW